MCSWPFVSWPLVVHIFVRIATRALRTIGRTALGAAATGRVFKVASPRVYRRQLAAQRAMVQHASEAARPSGALD
ncbi:uncharacterized protein LOC142566388 isoform X3 [Dermacentor variabilis]|uniref:uncharacterized protein LOC142566388 isoform X3 n=1 Tax=Dermacentor variabilis TaxID=34621 RepID=UPI003F5BA8E9